MAYLFGDMQGLDTLVFHRDSGLVQKLYAHSSGETGVGFLLYRHSEVGNKPFNLNLITRRNTEDSSDKDITENSSINEETTENDILKKEGCGVIGHTTNFCLVERVPASLKRL